MPSQTGGLLAGTAEVSVDGTTYMVTGDFKYKSGNKKRETLGGMDRIHGYKETPSAPFIAFNLRDWGGLVVGDINNWTDVTCVAKLANGKTVIGSAMWTVEEQEVDSTEAKFDVRLEGTDDSVTEVPTS
ncbi:phage tail protein [Burkholderia sp. ST111]|uniref:phage tail tube protein n=1 Tax=Paraburkholderia fungorum TaxID=134537 RepID=UPI0006B3FFFC|nr:phage tail tube protein [Paraburkholderia fungorum]KPD17266.1 phage tail protein [Burkholderia sp. ST111]PRZ56570.1 tail tube protein [Paraburkholderia fungorum]DAG71769.1 MAG TPA: Tail tube [Caudoviricetes sp.]DAG76224.1 MAG TPA: Tail tube [Caudoviricetes sp.]